ncbi:MAG TPA: peptidase, partial [bacterium]|nr:peptidase [bacterium]
MSQSGYYRFPTIHDDSVIFTSEDDLWKVSVEGGTASRLTSNQGEVSRPLLSPDGKFVAFTGKEEGENEIYVMPAGGGEETRLTYLGSSSYVVAWNHHRGTLVFASNAAQPFSRFYCLWEVDPDGGAPEKLPYGLAHAIAYGPQRGIVLGRNTGEPARWKRYRGGTVGILWIDRQGDGEFERLVNLDSNLTSPFWLDNRIYFISDHEGIGNLYSTKLNGSDLQRHSDQTEFYVRNTATDGRSIVYHAGGELYCYTIDTGSNRHIAVDYNSPRVQRNRKFVDAANYLEEYNIHPAGHSLVTTHRGKSYTYANWEGAVEQIGAPNGVRYQHSMWLYDGKSFITVSDVTGEEVLEIYSEDITQEPAQLSQLNCGRPLSLVPSPVENKVALSNHRHEVMIIDVNEQTGKVIDRSDY